MLLSSAAWPPQTMLPCALGPLVPFGSGKMNLSSTRRLQRLWKALSEGVWKVLHNGPRGLSHNTVQVQGVLQVHPDSRSTSWLVLLNNLRARQPAQYLRAYADHSAVCVKKALDRGLACSGVVCETRPPIRLVPGVWSSSPWGPACMLPPPRQSLRGTNIRPIAWRRWESSRRCSPGHGLCRSQNRRIGLRR